MKSGDIKMQAMNYAKRRIPIEATSIYDKEISTTHLIIFLDSYLIHMKFSGVLPTLNDVGRIIGYTANSQEHLHIVKSYYSKRISSGYVIGGTIKDIDIGFGSKSEKLNINSIW